MTSMSKLEGFVHEQMQKWKVPGVAIGIFDGDDVEFAGFGITNIETGQPVAPETLFQIGSISKIFTATLAMTLVDDGLLDLDAPIVTYVPEVALSDSDARSRITATAFVHASRPGSMATGSTIRAMATMPWNRPYVPLATCRSKPRRVSSIPIAMPGSIWSAGRSRIFSGRRSKSAMRERVFDTARIGAIDVFCQ